MTPNPLPHVVILGGGFGGLWTTRALARAAVRITLVDRANHHLFQPLLYQVATAGLSSPDIAAPLRHILRSQRNVTVRLDTVLRIDPARRQVECADGALDYDYLVVAGAHVKDDVVYRIAKAMHENKPKLVESLKAFGGFNPAGMNKATSAPFHPGAVKFYQEKGLAK